MKTFLLTSGALLVAVLIVVIIAFVFIQRALAPNEKVPASTAVESSSSSAAGVQGQQGGETESPSSSSIPSGVVPPITEPILLSSLPLSDTQKSLLETAGIDVATFVITPEMITCAQAALGATRFAQIVAGDAPGPTEMFALLRCL